MVNNGATMVIKPNTSLVINGDFINQLGGNINCEGLIASTGNWTNNATGGNLLQGSTGKVNFKGTQQQTIGGTSPTWFPELVISEGPDQVNLESDISCSDDINISGRELLLNGHTLLVDADVKVSANGTLTIDEVAMIEMSDNQHFLANNTATVKFLGSETYTANIKSSSGYYFFEIQNGATIHASNTIFENMELDGLEIYGNIDPLNSFHNCTFQYGKPDGTLITFNNPDPLDIYDAKFPENTWGSNYNVTKLNVEGRITFNEAIGNFAGEWFENDPNTSVDWVNTQMMAEHDLEEGWNGMSSWLIPAGEDIEEALSSVMPDMIIAATMDGVFYPAQNINTIGSWESHDAFMIKMADPGTLSLLAPPETNNVVPLNEGWTLMPVVSPIPENSDELFSGINSALQIVKEVAGTKVFWPDVGIYTLNEIETGKAYLIRCSEPVNLVFAPFPPDGWFKSVNLSTNYTVNQPWNRIVQTNISHTIGFSGELTNHFNDVDVLGVFTREGKCAGVAVAMSDQPFALTAFADDPLTQDKEGFLAGEPLSFKKYAPDSKEETTIKVIFDQEFPDAEGVFTPDGLSVVKEVLLEPETTGQDKADHQLNIYPNPTSGLFTVSDVSDATQLVITDAKGIQIMNVSTTCKKQIEIDLSGQQQGIYFISVLFPDKTLVKKVVLK